MAKPSQEAIETFMNITGVPESVAVQKLEEHGGNLNEAVNSHFSEGDGNRVNTASSTAPPDDAMDIDDPVRNESCIHRPPSLLSAEGRVLNPFSLLDDSVARRFIDHGSDLGNRVPVVTHPIQVREIPIEDKGGNGPSGSVGQGPMIEDISGSKDDHGPTIRGTVTIDEEDDDGEEIPAVPSAQQSEKRGYAPGVSSQDSRARPFAPEFNSLADCSDVEEEMIRAAIEASKKDIARIDNELYNSDSQHEQSSFKDAELAHAVSASVEEAEREKRLEGQKSDNQVLENVLVNPSEVELGKGSSSNGRFEGGTSSLQDEVEEAEQPLIRRRSRRTSSRSVQPVLENDDSPPSSGVNDLTHDPVHYENSIHSDEWGGISSLEHDEAVMLEAAMFGGIPEGSGYHFPYAPHQLMHGGGLYPRQAPRPPSPSLEAQRLIREQQDDEYLASLQADQEKELRAKAEAEARQLEEAAARQAALEEERRKEEECRRKTEEEQELERQLAAKEASLPQEPALDDDNAVTLLVKMPDGSRRGRRFLKSDNLQALFDFIDIGRGVKPGTYRLVRPYPRRAFSDGESGLALNELGLTSKQEALFLELI